MRPQLVEVVEHVSLHNLAVDGRHAVHAVARDDAQVGHAHHGGRRGDERRRSLLLLLRSSDSLLLRSLWVLVVLQDDHLGKSGCKRLGRHARVLLLDGCDEAGVNLLDQLHVARQQLLQQLQRPLLQRLGHHGVVGVGDSLGGDGPGGVVGQAVGVDEQAHELGGGKGGVGVVHLDGNLGGQVRPVGAPARALRKARQDVLQRRAAQHVLLLHAQRFALARAVARVEDGAELKGEGGGAHAGGVVAGIVRRQVKLACAHLRVPQAQRDGVGGAVARDGRVVRNSLRRRGASDTHAAPGLASQRDAP